jgi:2-amino-4-hydroxy-6-hydroxymethyldihydropteridine diphosphokinase
MSLRQALIGLGSNLGDRAATLAAAIARLRDAADYLEASSLYETEPVGVTDQPRFLNQVAGIETALAPEALLVALQQIEQAFGRERTLRWGPRTLDLDLLAYEGERRDSATLTLPHPRLLERAFVTVPLLEVLGRERFLRPGWDALRQQAERAAVDATGVQVFRA